MPISRRTIGRNIISNWAGFFSQVLITFLLTPFVLHQLGETRYGVWTLITSVTGYYGLIDAGLRSGLTQYITRYLAMRDFDRMNRSASSGILVLSVCAMAVLLIGAGLALSAGHLFDLEPALQSEVATCIVVLAIGTATQFLFFPFAAVLTATQRFDIANAIGVSTRLLTATAIFLCLRQGYGLIGLSLVTMAGNVIDYAVRRRFAYRVLPELEIRLGLANRKSCREFFSYGSWTFLAQSSTQIADSLAAIVIGLFMAPAAIGIYALAAMIVVFYKNFITPIGQVFFPVTTGMDAAGDTDGLKNIYMTGTRLILSLCVMLGFFGAFFADDFFRLWLGSEHVETEYGSVPHLFRVLIFSAGLAASQTLGNQVLLGQRRVKMLAALSTTFTLTYLSIALMLIPNGGLMGVAVAMLVSTIIFHGFVVPWLIGKNLKIGCIDYFLNVIAPPLAPTISFAIAYAKRETFLPASESWMSLILHGIILLVPILIVGFSITLKQAEKQSLVSGATDYLFELRDLRNNHVKGNQ